MTRPVDPYAAHWPWPVCIFCGEKNDTTTTVLCAACEAEAKAMRRKRGQPVIGEENESN